MYISIFSLEKSNAFFSAQVDISNVTGNEITPVIAKIIYRSGTVNSKSFVGKVLL